MASKKMTQREKKYRAELKKKWQEEGLIQPDKPRLNRKKFIEEAKTEWNARDISTYAEGMYLAEAFGIMLGHERKSGNLSLEAVGAAKVLKLAMRLHQFSKMVRERGDMQYKISEKFEYIRDILDA